MTVVKALGNFPIGVDNRPLRPKFQNIIHSHNSTWKTLALVGEKTPVCVWVVVLRSLPPPTFIQESSMSAKCLQIVSVPGLEAPAQSSLSALLGALM